MTDFDILQTSLFQRTKFAGDGTPDNDPLANTRALFAKYCGNPRNYDWHELAVLLGYKNMNKMRRRVTGWAEGYGSIPFKFLEYVGLDVAEIGRAVAADRKAWRRSLYTAPFPRKFVMRVFAAFYLYKEFPPECTDLVSACRYVRQVAMQEQRHCRFDLGPHITVYVSASGEMSVLKHRPKMQVVRDTVQIFYQ